MRKEICGIYAIRCIGNMKIYAGSSKNIEKRFVSHKRSLLLNNHHNKYLQYAYNKYGKDMFVYFMVEQCQKDQLILKEDEWIDRWDTRNREKGFNMQSANRPMGMTGLHHSKKTVELISANSKRMHKNRTHWATTPVSMINRQTGLVIKAFSSIKEAMKETGFAKSTIYAHLHKLYKYNTKNGHCNITWTKGSGDKYGQ